MIAVHFTRKENAHLINAKKMHYCTLFYFPMSQRNVIKVCEHYKPICQIFNKVNILVITTS